MTLSKQLFPLLFLFFFFLIFPLRHALNPIKCPSSFTDSYSNRCERFGVPIRFPFCGHSGFNLHCNDLNKTVLELPMSGTFLVNSINYREQEITITDPEDCLVKQLLNFNTSGSPFSPRFNINYTFLTCPKNVAVPLWYPSITCLSNSSSSFYATSNFALANSMVPSCQIVKTVGVPVSSLFQETGFSSSVNYLRLLLKWDEPNCRGCESDYLRCGFKNKVSLEVKCFDDKSGNISTTARVMITAFCVIGGIFVFATCIAYSSNRFVSMRRQNEAIAARTVRQEPRGVVVTRGLDQSTIESYKTVELGESRRLPGTNGIICAICLSEYATKESVRCIPECEHCFHVECIDVWLKIHGSCPICRNSHS